MDRICIKDALTLYKNVRSHFIPCMLAWVVQLFTTNLRKMLLHWGMLSCFAWMRRTEIGLSKLQMNFICF